MTITYVYYLGKLYLTIQHVLLVKNTKNFHRNPNVSRKHEGNENESFSNFSLTPKIASKASQEVRRLNDSILDFEYQYLSLEVTDRAFASLLKEQYHSALSSNRELSRYALYDPFYNKKDFKRSYRSLVSRLIKP